jgi:hypothetical protein
MTAKRTAVVAASIACLVMRTRDMIAPCKHERGEVTFIFSVLDAEYSIDINVIAEVILFCALLAYFVASQYTNNEQNQQGRAIFGFKIT